MQSISKLRFDALAGYSRSPTMPLVALELDWFEEADEKLLGLIVLDLFDRDYASYALGRDAKGRFRAVSIDCSIRTQEEASAVLEAKLAELARRPREDFYQGDERGESMDFFTPIVDAQEQNADFHALISQDGFSPALWSAQRNDALLPRRGR